MDGGLHFVLFFSSYCVAHSLLLQSGIIDSVNKVYSINNLDPNNYLYLYTGSTTSSATREP